MFEAAEVGNKLDKAEYGRQVPVLRAALLAMQKRLAGSGQSAIVLIGGVEGAGKSESVNLLLSWLDARGIQVNAPGDPSDEERERPPMWRYWRLLPKAGSMGMFLGSWYTAPIIGRVFSKMRGAEFAESLDRILEFEGMLSRENVILVKLWMHISKKSQRKRLQALSDDPDQSWRVSKTDWKYFKHYDDFRAVSEQTLRRTSTGEAPWHLIEAHDPRYRGVTVARTLLEALGSRLSAGEMAPKLALKPDHGKAAPNNLLRKLDLTQKLSGKVYDRKQKRLTAEISRLSRHLYERGRSLILVFEGADAAGKGGTIRRVIAGLDARNYQVISVAAPTDEERSHPYLWRFWRHLPRQGKVTIYDRSWYGRVLVERVEGFCAPEAWQRAYAEINGFEEQLTEFGTLILKFWLTISPAEQLRRFHNRELTPYKQYKITEEDWRNRKKWNAYEAAACEMIEKTGTQSTPWVLVSSEDKNWGRIQVLSAVHKALKKGLKGRG